MRVDTGQVRRFGRSPRKSIRPRPACPTNVLAIRCERAPPRNAVVSSLLDMTVCGTNDAAKRRHLMITGNGYLNLPDGRCADVSYQFSSEYDDQRDGYLFFETEEFDDGLFGHRMRLACDDGTTVLVVVVNRSDRHLAVAGRLLSSEEALAA